MTITCMPINRIRKLAADRKTQEHQQLQVTGQPEKIQGKRKAKRCQKTPKILRLPNAFVIFSNEWRKKKLAALYPADSNNQISMRLGCMWRALDGVEKDEYFARARQADAEHKTKYPDYVYNPNQVRKLKRLREQARKRKLRRPRRQSAKRRPTSENKSSALPLPVQEQEQEHEWGGFPTTQGVASLEGQFVEAFESDSASTEPFCDKWLMDADLQQFINDEIPAMDDNEYANICEEIVQLLIFCKIVLFK